MRISERQRYWVANRRIDKGRNDNTHALDILSTQKRINKLADDPIGMVRSLKLKDRLAELKSFKDNIDYSKGFLEVTESAISNLHQRLERARELALSMANDTYDGNNRRIVAKEVKELMTEITSLANSKYGVKYVFSGFRSLSPSVDLEGNFLGDDGQIFLQIGEQQFKRINIPGRELFEADESERKQGHFNLMDALSLLQQGLENNDKDAIYKSIGEFDYQLDKLASFQASVGATWKVIEDADKRLDYDELQKTTFLSKIEDADIYKASSDFKRTESVLQSTLLASNKLLQPSLLNFLQ